MALGWTDGYFTFALETRTNVLVPGVFGSSTAATAADIVACLRANPEAATEVRRALMGHGDHSRAATLLAAALEAAMAENERLREALREIAGYDLRICGDSVAHEMRDEARAALEGTK